eukprot:jgi/Chlat1/7336/Chrsp59S06971
MAAMAGVGVGWGCGSRVDGVRVDAAGHSSSSRKRGRGRRRRRSLESWWCQQQHDAAAASCYSAASSTLTSTSGRSDEGAERRLHRNATVGVFDSGVGGLSVVAALQDLQPALRVRYVADTAFFPYGDKSPEVIAARVLHIGRTLEAEGCDLLVVACNTASSMALEELRGSVGVPVVGMEPPLKPAIALSQAQSVIVMATQRTVDGARLAALADAVSGPSTRVWVLPMSGLADLVEAGELSGPRLEALLRESLAEPLADGADVIALGCTHYRFVQDAIARVAPNTQIIDAALPVARRAVSLLGLSNNLPHHFRGGAQQAYAYGLDASSSSINHNLYYTQHILPHIVRVASTGDPANMSQTIRRLRAGGARVPRNMQIVMEAHC